MGPSGIMCLLIFYTEKGTIALHNLNLILRRHQKNPNGGTLKNNWLVLFKVSVSWETKKEGGIRIRGDSWDNTTKCYMEDLSGTTGETVKKSID